MIRVFNWSVLAFIVDVEGKGVTVVRDGAIRLVDQVGFSWVTAWNVYASCPFLRIDDISCKRLVEPVCAMQ